ncbi:MAG TPA: hypothetical protein HA254_04885 [Candidatus Diapherotrites archaeon]|uniref:Uncharacterized protein n=1 Tax=Candidatus Iainarchaeum sp. TaxID=3101447 RepID=A0A7J4IYP6_9ARCH|nr:hypothetical protein [Candidatus Diapherotrites archaeon]
MLRGASPRKTDSFQSHAGHPSRSHPEYGVGHRAGWRLRARQSFDLSVTEIVTKLGSRSFTPLEQAVGIRGIAAIINSLKGHNARNPLSRIRSNTDKINDLMALPQFARASIAGKVSQILNAIEEKK